MILSFHHEVLDNFENVFLKKLISGWSEASHRRSSMKKGVLESFVKFTGKHLCQSLLFNKVADLRPVTLLKKRLWHRCFPENFVKFLQNTSGRLLLVGCEKSTNSFKGLPK